MSGLDKMKSQILDEASHSAEMKIAEAKAKAEEILNEARAEAEAKAEKISGKSQEKVKDYEKRVASSCEMQRKQAVLGAKQELIADVLAKAYERVIGLDGEPYFDMVRRMLIKYVLPESGVIYFSDRDLSRMPKGFEQEIQKAAAEKGGVLELSRDARDIDGGFILVYGGIEENCTIKALFDAQRDELSDKVHGLLFS